MSIKDLFYKKEVVLEDRTKLTSSVESADLIDEIREQNQTFVPDVDFSNPENFVRFGSAKEYYEGSIKRVYQQYPYDGSEAEKLSFYNDSTFLDQWMLDNKYPKSTGYAIFSAEGWGSGTTITDYGKPNNLEYIYSAGGLREAPLLQYTGSDTISSGQLKNVFDKGVKHNSDKNRTLSYRMKMDDGLSIQFWMKKDAFDSSKTKREVILDLWNGVTTSGSHDYGRLILEMSASDKQESALRLTLYSGSYGIVDQPIALSSYGSASIANGEWQHHTITVKAASQNLEINYYNNGILNRGSTYGTTNTLGEIPNNINGYLGALQTASYGDDYNNEDMVGAGKLSASLDDFRYWKKELDAQYIKNTWFYPIGGGSNSDDNRTSLGVYYKFNEGIVSNTDYDSVVLDYSGRIANGTWTGYTTSSRNTGSAYVSASILQSEPGDPIIRIDHPSVQSLLTEMATSGSNYDRDNTSRIYDMVPVWLREEDTNNNINYLFQILSSYFDTLYCQIKELPKLKDKNYFDGGNMPYGFIDRLLEEKGMLVPNTFISSDVLTRFWQRDENNNYFEQSIEKTKRQIYYNIYNNLDFILKSKGTEKSFRNLLRCFGIDDEVVKLNVYTDNATHYIVDRYKNSSVKSKFANFNKPSRAGASITQTTSSINSLSFISGSDTARLERNNAFTIEGDVLFPSPKEIEDDGYFVTSFISSSIFGFHEANSSDSTDYTFGGSNDANLQFYAVRDVIGSDSAKFVITNADNTIFAESQLFDEVYNNERWNFSLTVEPVGYPFAGSFLSSSNPDYNISLYGVTYNNEEIKSQFTLTASVSNTVGVSLLTKPKRLYVGANKTNFTGSTIASTDVKIGSIRMWMDKLSNEAIQQHNLDPKNYGHNKIYGSPTVFFHDISDSSQIPAMDSLILHWNFDKNSSSDASGEFIVEDFSSGSTSNLYGWASNIIERENKGLGLDFPASEEVFTNEFIFARRKELPEISFTDDKITIMDDEKEFFIEDEDTTDNVFSLEKSMNQSISEEMIRTFATMKEYANLFAKPVDYYRHEYKRLRKARSLFFERTTGNPDFDKFTEYFKWIDTSVSFFIEQLKPASVTFTEGVANVVESHIFERPKNDRKFPTVKTLSNTMGSIRGIGELDYNWKFGHAPDYKSSTDNIHCLWEKERKERSDIADRETIRKIIGSKTSGIIKRFGDPTTSPRTGYIAEGYAEAVRRFSKPYKVSVDASTTIHGGINYNQNRNRDFIYDNIKPHGSKTSTGIPVNVVVVGVGPGQGIINSSVCDDVEDPNKKEKYNFRMTVGKDSSGDGSQPSTGSLDLVYEVKSAYGSPFNIVSGNVDDGTNRTVDQNYKDNVILTNLHSDTTYISNDVPMQGPFTETWVGGRQNRHVQLNKYNEDYATINKLDDQYTRPEAYRILFGEHPDESVQDGAIGIVGPDYGGPYPDTTRKWAIYYRDLRGKRPYNIQNIQGDQYRQGNYTRKYEYVNSVGRLENNSRFKKAASESTYEVSGVFLPAQIKSALPETTHPLTLVGIATSDRGNTFGVGESNRINAHLETLSPEYLGSGSFQVTGATQYLAPYSASLEIQGIPKAAQHDFISFKVSGSSDLSDGDLLQLTASSTNKLIEVDSGGALSHSPDIFVDTYRRAIQHTDLSSYAFFYDASYIGFGTSDYTVSFWLNNVTATSTNGSNQLYFFDTGNDSRHYINFDDDIVVRYENSAGTQDLATFNTNIQGTSGWNHYVITFAVNDLSTGVPRLWKNGTELSDTAGFSSIGGTTPNIDYPRFFIDEGYAIQDLVFWNIVFGQPEVDELYNSGVWFDPSTHASASNVIGWHPFGEEPEHRHMKPGDTFLDDGSSNEEFYPVHYPAGDASNSLRLISTYDEHAKIIKGFGNKTNTEIWNNLTASLESEFSGYTATYISGATDAQFFLRKDTAGSNTVTVAKTGTSFDNLVSGSGATAVDTDLEDGDTVTIDGTVFTVRHTTSGSAATDLIAGSSYRKATHFKSTSADSPYLSSSYTNPTSDNISLSFWTKMDDVSGDAYLIDFKDSTAAADNLVVYREDDNLKIYLNNVGAGTKEYTYSDILVANEWQHYTININTLDVTSTPVLYKNGQTISSTSNSGTGTGGLENLESLFIGDHSSVNSLFEWKGTVQDMVVWNTGLNAQDAKILYNSGSWFDIHSHVSASSIWDWWTLGEEGNYTSGSNLSANSISSFSPTIGRHTLVLGPDAAANVFITDGTIETPKSNVNFWNEMTQSFKDNTLLTGSYFGTYLSSTLFSITASTVPHTGTFSLSENGDTFDITVVPFKGPDDLTTNNGGAVDDDYIQIGSTRFIIDADNSNAGGNYAQVGDHYYVYSSGSSDQFWTRLSGALAAEFTNYEIVTSSTGETTSVFSFTASSAPDPGYILTRSGTSYSNLFNITASTTTVYETGLTNVVEKESDFLTGSIRNKTVITSRFSAPGGVEVQTYGYLDAYAREYSVHNNLNYRNLSIRGSGSGESGTIRVNSHANTRDGLRTLYQRPMGRGGVDSVYEQVDETDYNLTASFHKVPRNTLVTPRSGSSAVEIVERSNNYNYQSTIPASDYNYSWVTSSLGDNYNVRSGTQKVFGYWPKDGLNKVNEVFDSAITFPSSSDIVGV